MGESRRIRARLGPIGQAHASMTGNDLNLFSDAAGRNQPIVSVHQNEIKQELR
ncbi:hypothetical cytosolic protein [Syntrophus aciditrophicus SB]|uniref:Hypothetical cytosolic protein n=1 Tax=Syntrophus aciditrophicus (strain SB) TaxID=56780 RepID=Q2LV74_SYNAS|nr:hypothetical cytosolic protein [Syntrophus aciditrophicus SB]